MTSNELLSVGLTHLWQVSIVILVVAIAARLFARNRPHLAMTMWLLVLIKCVTPPIVFAPFGLFCSTIQVEYAPTLNVDSDHSTARFFERRNPDAILQSTTDSAFNFPIDEFPATVEPLSTSQIIVWIWVIGAGLIFTVTVLRLFVCLRKLNSTQIDSPPELSALLEELRQELGVTRKVNLFITSSAIGPAIIGLFRLRVVIPELIASNHIKHLRPILAHELIHLRRGDVWVGLLNLCTKVLWWFHPLVWWVSRQINHDTERACDEEVLAALKCRPIDYARSLLQVLEQKNLLKAIPSFPGVRPVEITSQRMERIMSLRQGSRSPRKWIYRVAIVVAAALTLPGAVVSQDVAPTVTEAVQASPKSVTVNATLISVPKDVADELFSHRATDEKENVIRQASSTVAKPVTINSESRTRTISTEQRDVLLKRVRKSETAYELMTPTLVVASGRTAKCETSIAADPQAGEAAMARLGTVRLQVKPKVHEDGIELSGQFEQTWPIPSPRPEMPPRIFVELFPIEQTLKQNRVLIADVASRSNGMHTVMVLSATLNDSSSPLPPTQNLPVTAMRQELVVINATIFTRKPNAPRVAIRPDANIPGLSLREKIQVMTKKTGMTVAKGGGTTRLISGGSTDGSATITGEFTPDVATKLGIASSRVGFADVYELTASDDVDGFEVLSRPRITTVNGQPARIEVGSSSLSGKLGKGLRVDITPAKAVDGSLQLSGSVMVRDGKTEIKRSFSNLNVSKSKCALLTFDVAGDEEPYAICLQADELVQHVAVPQMHAPAATSQTQTYRKTDAKNTVPGKLQKAPAVPAVDPKMLMRTPGGPIIQEEEEPLILGGDNTPALPAKPAVKLKPGDALRVGVESVFGSKDKLLPVSVRGDGTISVPIVHAVAVAGLTVAEAAIELRTALADKTGEPGEVSIVLCRESDPRPTDFDLDHILESWHNSTQLIETLESNICRRVYHHDTETEVRSDGRIQYVAPFKLRVTFSRSKHEGSSQRMSRRTGQPYRLVAGETGGGCVELSETPSGKLADAFFPLFVSLAPDELKKRYHVQLEAPKDNRYWQLAIVAKHQIWWKHAKVIIDRKSHLVLHAQLTLPNRTEVYSFGNMIVNKPKGIECFFSAPNATSGERSTVEQAAEQSKTFSFFHSYSR